MALLSPYIQHQELWCISKMVYPFQKKCVLSSLHMHLITYTGRPKKMQSSLFPLFLQTSISNIKSDFMVKMNDILEINCYSFNQIRSSMSKLRGKVWHLYHSTPTQYQTYGENWFWVSSQSRMLKIAAWLACSVCSHALEIYLVLEWNDRGVKLCLMTLSWMIGFAWNCNRLFLRYHSLQPWSHFLCYLSYFEEIMVKVGDCILLRRPVYDDLWHCFYMFAW